MDYAGALQDRLIVLVEDHDDFRYFLSEFLIRHGATVLPSSDALEALRLVEEYRPSVVLTDIGLPGRNGFQLLQDIRALDPLKGGTVPVIAMTAFGQIIDRRRAILAGFQNYLAKPFLPDELLEAVKSLI
ncbi:MAG TPA: response regulator [Chthoniobacterales bacterium]|jgi:CheY-like chemotaxis protein|nr:response regulator [Chthoniobacterales bacterium]